MIVMDEWPITIELPPRLVGRKTYQHDAPIPVVPAAWYREMYEALKDCPGVLLGARTKRKAALARYEHEVGK